MTDEPSKNPNFIRQEQLAPTGVHDTHFYDPNATEDQVVVMFETYERAQAARDVLVGGGIPRESVDVLHNDAAEEDAGFAYPRTPSGFWGAMRNLFSAGEEPQHGYAEGLRRGHALLRVKPAPGQRLEVVRLLATTEPLDFDARLEEWRSAGWNGIYAEREASEPVRTASPGAMPASQPAASATTTALGGSADVVSTGQPKGSSGAAVEGSGIAGQPNPTEQGTTPGELNRGAGIANPRG
jgi:hypothetical protein